MTLRIYNTLTREKEEFHTLEPGKVRMYVCGPTVYDRAHIGHAMSALVFDIVRRYLEYSGYEVRFVMNFTDVDDKIIDRAKQSGADPFQLAQGYIDDYKRNLEALNIKPATVNPRATQEMAHILEMVQALVEKGFAYPVDGDVYYRVDSDPEYGKLSGRRLESMNAGARIQVDDRKEHPMDFALWKAAKPGEPAWDSPWGPGRPGWHIECSAMSMAYLGESFDIHGGGKDLVFPHHENEIAQSEGATCQPYAKYWLHNGFVNVNQEKMSKSLGNFFTIRDILQTYDAEVLRFFILTAHYRSPIDFSDQNLQEAQVGLSRFYEGLQAAAEALDASPDSSAESKEGADLEARFREAMDDDFNTAAAIGHLFEGVRTINRLVTEKGFRKSPDKIAAVRELRAALLRLGDVLGLFSSEPAEWLQQLNLALLKNTGLTEADVRQAIEERQAARRDKDFARSDQIRDELAAKGVQLLDGPQGTTWKAR